ncbi:hypothetical protein EDB81DRAFT_18086 [Dactylonectria macrodidyma]|uniref:DUF7924 domain-containing protein n=1 Tax=Dactylonectria macrodidyma TaxID=307937 RepID=A0A9P9JN16_9HYPO|nr:hypothetical protein EDB81DRAFT_18086 [Dactylonectria macrodidyma]
MNGRVTKAQTRRSLATPSKAVQAKLLDAAADKSAELPRSHREQSPVNKGLTQDAAPVPTAKRQLDATPESDPLPAKRARLTQTDAQQPRVEKAEQTDKTLQQPEPRHPKQPYASFLKDFVDPTHPHPRPESLHTFVSEWLESVGSDRDRRCRSASHLHRSDDDPFPRQLTRSAPEMSHTQDADGFVVPPTPASTRSRASRTGSRASRADSEDDSNRSSASSTANVCNRRYRQNNLALNNIYIQHPAAPLLDVVSSHVDNTVRAKRDSPELSSDELKQAKYRLGALEDGCDEDDVVVFLNDIIFPDPKTDATYGPATGLASGSGALMSRHLVPVNLESMHRVSQPKPDKLYGYSWKVNQAFTQSQLLAQQMLHPRNPDYPAATSNGLRFPFFAIEFKAAGGTRGDLWVAANQCAGASSACLNAVSQLNTVLQEHWNVQRVDNISYCIAVDNKVAELYVSWKEDSSSYYLQRVDSFLLSRSEDLQNFRKQVRNILDWGKDARLTQIGDALDIILKENRKSSSEAAKSRPPPSDSSVASGKQKASSRRNNNRSDNSQAQTRAIDGPYQRLDEAASQDVRDGQPSHRHQQQSFVDADDYTSQGAGEHGHRPSSHRHKSNGPATPSYVPTPPRLSGERRESIRSSPSRDDSANSTAQKHTRLSCGTIEYWE